MPVLQIKDLGLRGYAEVWESQKRVQQAMVDAKRAGNRVAEEQLWLVEHTDVITLGRHAEKSNLLFAREELARRGVEVYDIERGGDVTYHGPGQLVAYPLIDLEAHRLGVKSYVDLLEESVIRTIAHWGIKGERVEGATGVWIGKGTPAERKICAIGVKCTRFVTMHGLALNVNTDLSRFNLINPCGFTDKGVTSIAAEVGMAIPMPEVKQRLSAEFRRLLGYRTND